MPYLRAGSGSPLVFLPGIFGSHRRAARLDRWMRAGPIALLARLREVWWTGRRPGLPGTVDIDDDPDLLLLLDAEDRFDPHGRLPEIAAPTLVLGGDSDGFYTADVFRETVGGIPAARLVLYPGVGQPRINQRRINQRR